MCVRAFVRAHKPLQPVMRVRLPWAWEGDARASTGAAPAAAAPLPSLDSLQGIASEYREFLKPGVDETLKRAALKKLFNDPHFGFAAMDKLDIYIDDYSIEDPIPEALLRTLNQSKSLFLFEEKKEEGESALQSDNGALADVVSAPELLDVPAGSAEAADTAGSGMAEIPMPGQGIKGAPKTV